MDFYNTMVKQKTDGTNQVRPDWKVGRSKDLMTRGGDFYAIWDEAAGMWSTDIYDVQRLVDAEIAAWCEAETARTGIPHKPAKMSSHSSKLWDDFHRYLRNSGNNSHNLDETLVFSDTVVTKESYSSKRLGYALRPGNHDAWDNLVGTLYNQEERAKIEWAIGAVVSGDSKEIQKFLVFYGPPGSGKSTILNIIQKLFKGYTTVFDARELVGNNNAFATSAFQGNPLVAVQHDGDLSRIADNTKLNSIVSHETMVVNQKYKAPFESRSISFLFMGTNVPVKITDAKSGVIRRLIDVVPTQQTIEHDLYHQLLDQVNFELGAIAAHCLETYRRMGRNYYSSYRPTEMMLQTDMFYNYVEAHFDLFKADDGVSLKRAWALYKEYCAETGLEKVLPQYKVREELKNYFFNYDERITINGVSQRKYYSGFKHLAQQTPTSELPIKPPDEFELVLREGSSLFDEVFAGQPAQYANKDGNPKKKWADVTTVLSDLDTTKLHWVKVPENHIVIDFDRVGPDGEKSLSANLEAAASWPVTYTELSKSGNGLHLHYTYTGDVSSLASIFDDGIEIKTLLGGGALRRKLSKCNHLNFTPIDSGLPTKEKAVISQKSIQSERGLRSLIERNLKKEFHAGTKPSIDFIVNILDEAYESGMAYDVRDMRGVILTFAGRSTHHGDYCIQQVQKMKFLGDGVAEQVTESEAPIIFFDVEVFPNLFVVCWKAQGSEKVVRMINPSPSDVEKLFAYRLVGFNNRRYDNHILYGRYLGYTNEELYRLSQKIITGGNERTALFGEAYHLSYADIYDFSSVKMGLKKWQLELGIFHSELDIPWDEPVDEKLWNTVADYCCNDVVSTEAVFDHRKQDFIARQILADITGLTVNHTNQNLTQRLLFGEDKNPQRMFEYTHLEETFPGYRFDGKDSHYRDEITGEGGYVYAEPGAYENVLLLDVASMHPTSIRELNIFGPYTARFNDLTDARLAIKRADLGALDHLLDGKLTKFVGGSEGELAGLSDALKIVINTVYGLTSARFETVFRDLRNKDNIVAKRGALFMVDLKHHLQEHGYQVVHIKTDSVKIPLDDPASADMVHGLVQEFGKRYGYTFELEAIYKKFCLVNDAVYVAYDEKKGWSATGAQFQHPYVFKSLFTDEKPEFEDFCETKSVMKGAMYLDFSGSGEIENMVHVGRTGSFLCSIDRDGGDLWRVFEDRKWAVTGTKGFKWITREQAESRNKTAQLILNMAHYDGLLAKAREALVKYTDDVDEFRRRS